MLYTLLCMLPARVLLEPMRNLPASTWSMELAAISCLSTVQLSVLYLQAPCCSAGPIALYHDYTIMQHMSHRACTNLAAPCRYAWYKLYNLAKSYNKNLAASDVQMLAGNVLLSALAISPYSAADSARSEADAEQEKERSARMANLLGFTVVRAWSVTCSTTPPHCCTDTESACLLSCQLSSTAEERHCNGGTACCCGYDAASVVALLFMPIVLLLSRTWLSSLSPLLQRIACQLM